MMMRLGIFGMGYVGLPLAVAFAEAWEVVDAAATKPFGFTRFDPGPGMGGHCLPVGPPLGEAVSEAGVSRVAARPEVGAR